jgi:hypothetical protein
MQLMQAIQALEARISGGADYQWNSYGSHARFMNFVDRDGLECASIVYDTQLFRVYEMDLYVPGQPQAFRWIDPEYRANYLAECTEKNCGTDVAWDDVKYTEVDEETILQYASDIAGTYYDNLPIVESV